MEKILPTLALAVLAAAPIEAGKRKMAPEELLTEITAM